MNLNVVLRHELHASIKRATPDQLFTALHSPASPIRDRFIRFLALSYADWLSTQTDIDDELIKRDWREALTIQPTLDSNNSSDNKSNLFMSSSIINGASHYSADPSKSGEMKKRKSMREKQPMLGFLTLTDKEPIERSNSDNNNNNNSSSSSSSDNIDDDDDSTQIRLGIQQQQHKRGYSSSSESDSDSSLSSPQLSRSLFDELTTGQKMIIKSKLGLLQEIANIEKRNEELKKKKLMLAEILEYIARSQWYSELTLQQIVDTISVNLFRSLPRRRSKNTPEIEDEPFEDPSWPHLQLVYDLTLRLVICTNVDKRIMRKYLEGSFVDHIIELFSSEDPREREYLKTILHRIYGRFMPLRQVIRQSIANCCYRTIYEEHGKFVNQRNLKINLIMDSYFNSSSSMIVSRIKSRPANGIAEFLEIFCSIIHGFSIPVKKEHKDFLRNVLIPLHKCRKLDKFHEQLVACCVQFIFKDPAVASVVLGGLLKFWPVQSPNKEEMFIAEAVNIINAMINHKSGFNWNENRDISIAVIDQLVQCMKSKHHSVAERALMVWTEDAVEILVDLDKVTIWPKIVAAFMDNKEHWNESLRDCNDDVMDGFRVRDHSMFHKIREEYLRSKTNPRSITMLPSGVVPLSVETKKQRWVHLKTMASTLQKQQRGENKNKSSSNSKNINTTNRYTKHITENGYRNIF